MSKEALVATVKVKVRYSETDAIGVVWHGNYLRYFEDGREAFGEKYGLEYLEIYTNDFIVPLVQINCDFLSPLKYGEAVLVETKLVNTKAAKIIFEYNIYRESDNKKVAAGSSTQVFVTKAGEFSITVPEFYKSWKQKHGLE
ncbi:MAG TPA: acyl-CoA thioesterase [Flavobacteriales bacterium]|jgi:acyl-CoA thioester hydrolase|nr:acyl-CoA thioesterase [Flavobacteriales bacterium]HIA10775.1 acyl-CoA thioesterase [Flavobacteriales bacterium]HIO72659.1 acyl-CoA thioesterase [Flavobacteriales bacterium]